MSDDPFAAFKEGQPPAQEAPAAKAAKKPRKKKAAGNGKAKPPAAVEAAPAPNPPKAGKKERKARKPRQAKEMRLPISMLLEIGSLSEEESGALLSIGAGLQKLPEEIEAEDHGCFVEDIRMSMEPSDEKEERALSRLYKIIREITRDRPTDRESQQWYELKNAAMDLEAARNGN